MKKQQLQSQGLTHEARSAGMSGLKLATIALLAGCGTLLSGTVALAETSAENSTAIAEEITPVADLESIGAYAAEGSAAQVTSVSQLTDVKPTDWAFQALQSLVERYGCIVGYPNKTYRGNRALSRYEFAAGLNACLDKI